MPLRPPEGAPNVLVILHRRLRLRRRVGASAGRSTRRPPSGSRRTGCKYNRFHTTALCSPTRQALLTGRNHHTRRHGRHHRNRDLGARLHLDAAQHLRAAGRDAEAQRLLDRAVRQVPRGAGVGDQPDGPLRRTGPPAAAASSTSTASSAARPTSTTRRSTKAPCRSSREETPEEGYHFTEDMTDKAINWVRQQKALMPDKPFFVYFAPGATHAPHHVPHGVVGQVQGQVRSGLGCASGRDVRRARRHLGVIPPDAELTTRPPQIPAWEECRSRRAAPGPADGGVRRVPGAHRLSRWPPDRRAGGHWRS